MSGAPLVPYLPQRLRIADVCLKCLLRGVG
jgi:hypothetical protein